MSNPVVIDATPGQSYADISREFEAPVAAVFRAHADRELFREWIGPRALQTTITEWDFRTGGRYRYEQTDPQGNVYAFNGVFHTVRENELIIQTFEYEGDPRRGEHRLHALRGAAGRSLATGRPQRVPLHRGARGHDVRGHGVRHERGLREARRAAGPGLTRVRARALTQAGNAESALKRPYSGPAPDFSLSWCTPCAGAVTDAATWP